MKPQDLIKKLQEISSKTDADIEKVESVDEAVVVTFKKENFVENTQPKSWEEFCDMFKITLKECYIGAESLIYNAADFGNLRDKEEDKNLLPDRATAEAIIALMQLIQLRNAYNGDWVPDWNKGDKNKYCIDFAYGNICFFTNCVSPLLLYFKSEELRDEFLRYFRPLIEKLKPLYGIKEGGEE